MLNSISLYSKHYRVAVTPFRELYNIDLPFVLVARPGVRNDRKFPLITYCIVSFRERTDNKNVMGFEVVTNPEDLLFV